VVWIDPAQQLALVIAEGDCVIGLPRTRLPSRFLASENDRQTIEVRDNAPVHRLIEGEQAGLVSQQLANGNLSERTSHGLKARAHLPLNTDPL
jgi:hypothetical protein